MPMTICTKPVPVRVPSPNMQQQQSHLRLERELSQTFERLRHIHSHPPPPEPTDVICLAAHPHRPILGPDPACLPFPGQQGEVVSSSSSSPYSSLTSSSSPYSSLTSSSSSSSSSCCSSSIDNWSKNGSPRQRRRVVFADSLCLPLADVRVFTCEPPDDAAPPCPMALRRGQRSLAVRGKQPCQQHHSAAANVPQACADFPQFPARQVQDKRTLQAHNDTLRRVNKTCPRVPLPQTMAKAHAHPPSSSHTQITEHTHPAACSHPPLEQAQVLGHTPPMGHTQRFAHTLLPKAHALSPSHTQGQRATYTAGHTHAPAEHAQRISHTLPKAHTLLHASSLQQRPQATAEHTHPVLSTQQQPTTAYTPSHTHQFAHTLPKGLGHAPGGGGTQGSPQQRHPSCGHLVSGTRQPLAPVPAGWPPRSRSPQLQAQPGPGSLPHVQNFAGHKWALQEGMMAVH
ncbi:uncharacterized protein LOC134458728 [Engraulis encrasicolus]|uniref:uncharacterized protein LOC134458728 n=1 Tax=Engraulis encrasicolus TaxID=184585 RepID=UPI002FD47328